MKTLNIIIVPQEFISANHKQLWYELQNQLEGEILIVDIPADLVVSKWKRKSYRIDESKLGKVKITEKMSIIRPIFFIRPEITPRIFNKVILKSLVRQIEKHYSNLRDYNVSILTYCRKWIDVLFNSTYPFKLYYYILDEFRYYPHKTGENTKAIKMDEVACRNSEHIFVMTKKILELRLAYKDKITVLGNGSSYSFDSSISEINFHKSVAFIGNFRNWIDIELLTALIRKRKDVLFGFAGPVEKNMSGIFQSVLDNNENTMQLGKIQKEKVFKYYRMFNAIIVPYKQNAFMSATRPIKIIEAVSSGVPVITIPMSGYEENSFIRFARDVDEFSKQIDFLLETPINKNSIEYKRFLEKNSWSQKAKIVAKEMNANND